jgi:hypothetical protein
MRYSTARRPKELDKCVRHIDDRPPLVPEVSRGHHNGTREMKHSDMNIDQVVSDEENSRLMKEGINKQWTACITPSSTNKNRACHPRTNTFKNA